MGAHDRESARRVSDCVGALLTEQPFFGSLALRLPLRPDPTRETLASDGRELRYSPAWAARTDGDRIKTAVARVVFACALKHHTRRGGRDPERWQRASQLVTHGELRRAGFVLPADAEAWEDVSVEDAYERLAGEEDGAGEPGPSGSGGEGAAGDEASGNGDDDSAGPSDDAGDDGDSGGSGPAGGSGRDGPAGEGEPPSHDPAGTGEVMDAAARGEKDDAASPGGRPSGRRRRGAGVGRGHAPGGQPRHRPGPSARAHRGDPSRRASQPPRLAHACSGATSCPPRATTTAGASPTGASSTPASTSRRCTAKGSAPSRCSSTRRARSTAPPWPRSGRSSAPWPGSSGPTPSPWCRWTHEVQDAAVYRFGDLPETLTARGRGGTDFRPGFAWLAREGIVPDCCLYLTDMECDRYPAVPPPFPVLWCNWGPAPPVLPEPWGERIDLAP